MVDYQKKLEELLTDCINKNSSDLHISVGRYPTLRIDGGLVPLSEQKILTPGDSEGLAFTLMSEEERQRFLKEKEIDFSYNLKGKARFRINVYLQSGFISIAFRHIPSVIKTVEELNLPSILHRFVKPTQGFVLVVGPSGHGKSTTLAALIDEVNHSRTEHIITIEDPIEYVFLQDRSIIDQREVFQDTRSFASALRVSFRQDPNILMVGEMRDLETMATALTAAETGHLVFSTLHTNNAAQTIDRIIDSFPANQQDQVRVQLAGNLLGVISQRLIPQIEKGRVPACEVMIANAAVSNIIRERRTHELDLVISTSAEEGMISLNRSLVNLVQSSEITLEDAKRYSLNPVELLAMID